MTAATTTHPAAPTRPEPFPRPWTPADFQTMQRLGLFADRAVSLDAGRLVEAGEPPRPVRLTRAEYGRLADAGVFRGQRVLLIDGEVLAMSPMNPGHANGLLFTLDALRAAFGVGFTFRPQLPMDLGQRIDPEPDVAVVSGPPRANTATPRTAALVVEVADTSFDYDTTEKASLYAAGGIPDYWVVDLVRGRLLVFRDPRPAAAERFGHGYARLSVHTPGDSVAPLAAAGSRVPVADLLP